jgi:hypothetical protein
MFGGHQRRVLIRALFSCAVLLALPCLETASAFAQTHETEGTAPELPGEESGEEREDVDGLFADLSTRLGLRHAALRPLDVAGVPRPGHFGPLERPPRA